MDLEHSDDFISYVNSNFRLIDGELFRVLFRGKECNPKKVNGSVNSTGYLTVYGGFKTTSVHVIVYILANGNYEKGLQIDHVNRNKLDNRPENLRAISDSKNKGNVGLRSDNKSGFKGVSYNKSTKKWVAQCHVGRPVYIGSYDTPQEASENYIKYKEGLNNG